MALYTELSEIIDKSDSLQNQYYSISEELLNRFHRFREAMQLIANTLSNQRGRAFLRKYENGERGKRLNQLESGENMNRTDLLLMLEFCQDANQLENHLKRTWKRFKPKVKS